MNLHTSAETSCTLDKQIPQAEPSCVYSSPDDLRELRAAVCKAGGVCSSSNLGEFQVWR